MASFSKGDRVAFSAKWLRSVCAFTGDLPFARGTVVAVTDWCSCACPMGFHTRTCASRSTPPLVEVAWDNLAGHTRVIAPNLTHVSRIAFDAAQ